LADQHGADHHHALDDELPVRPDTEQIEPIVQHHDDRDADERAVHAADAAGKGRSAHDDRGDGIEEQIATEARPHRTETGDGENGGEARRYSRDDEGANLVAVDRDARGARDLFAAADE
jgi:hypothetical protein